MIDSVRLNIKAGDGGNGCCSFLREKYRPRGGPNGGDGGHGGSAYICGDPGLNTLRHLKLNSTVYVPRGIHGKGKGRTGAGGEGVVIRVPLGTEVWIKGSDGGREFLFDAVDTAARLVARGGRGGWGNAHYVSATNQEPVLFEKGEHGERVVLYLELKLLADVGLIAPPNAGKSTLLSSCSAARPHVADYPFTTLEPVLGVVSHLGTDFVMMEVPGLVEGAHRGAGLGQRFLKHAERVRVYVSLVDGLAPDPVGDFLKVREELRRFNPAMVEKPQVVAINKIDAPEVRRQQSDLVWRLRDCLGEGGETAIFCISAATGEGVEGLLGKLVELLASKPRQAAEAHVSRAPLGKGQKVPVQEKVHKTDDAYVVESQELERLVALADTRDGRVIRQLWGEMQRRGLAKQLVDAGIEAGDTIRIGQVEVEWF